MGLLADLLDKHPEFASVKDTLLRIDQKMTALETENRLLRQEIDAFKGSQEKKEFSEAAGVLWKTKQSGGHEPMPYCPTCKSRLADYSGSLLCLKCNWQAPMKTFEVPKMYHDLFGEE